MGSKDASGEFFFFFFSFPHFSLLVPRKGEDGSNVIVTVLRSAFRNLSFLRFGVINHLLELIISIHPSMDVLDGREIPSSIPSSTREEKKKFPNFSTDAKERGIFNL